MTEILITTWAALVGVLSGVWSVVEVAATWVASVLYHLHVDAPRLEGLLVGVVLTWVLLRRDRHPVLRVLSAPLKLVIDILDLAWDQVVEVLADAKEALVGWASKITDPIKNAVKKSWSAMMAGLSSLKAKLEKRKNEEETD